MRAQPSGSTRFDMRARIYPMPYWAINTMTDDDLAALWSYARALGPAGENAPSALAPGVVANGPVVTFPAPPPPGASMR